MSDGRKLLFTSDWHLGHANIIKHCNRPFEDNDPNFVPNPRPAVEVMNSDIWYNMYFAASGADMMYILGDVSFMPWEKTEKALRRLSERCPLTLVCGNHDRKFRGKYAESGLFAGGVHDLLEIKYNRQHIVLCHFPLRTWNRSHRGSWHLHGHSHGSLPSEGLKRLDVGVDAHAFQPLTAQQICALLGGDE